jgi:serine protease Do
MAWSSLRSLALAGAVGATVGLAWTVLPSLPVAAGPATVAAAAATPALPAFADTIARVKPSVVTVEAAGGGDRAGQVPPGGMPFDEFFERFFGQQPGGPGFRMPRPRGRSLGSGFIIDAGGIVVTNNHVVAGSDEVTVTLDDGRELKAKVLGTDEATDIAVLQVDATGLPAVAFGDSDAARIGDWVIAIGNPFGFGGTVTVGIISARGRDLRAGNYDDFLQIDAPINSGNSGGPVFDADGRVIGITTAIFSPNGGSVGLGFAIPSSQARAVVEQIREHGGVRRGFLGVGIQPIDEQIANSLGLTSQDGALVSEVTPGSPAAVAGLEPGDVIVRFDGKDVETPRDLTRRVADTAVGSSVEVEYLRNGRAQRVKVKLAEREASLAAAPSTGGGGGTAENDLGLDLAPLDEALRGRLGLDAEAAGVVVRSVRPDGPAAERGVQPGDLIIMVNNERVHAPADVARAVKAARDADRMAVSLLLQRGSSKQFVAIDIG